MSIFYLIKICSIVFPWYYFRNLVGKSIQKHGTHIQINEKHIEYKTMSKYGATSIQIDQNNRTIPITSYYLENVSTNCLQSQNVLIPTKIDNVLLVLLKVQMR